MFGERTKQQEIVQIGIGGRNLELDYIDICRSTPPPEHCLSHQTYIDICRSMPLPDFRLARSLGRTDETMSSALSPEERQAIIDAGLGGAEAHPRDPFRSEEYLFNED